MKADTTTAMASPGLVVFGKDEAGKPHASVFKAGDAELAMKAARLMGMTVLRPVSEPAQLIAAKLPKGRVFASGRGFVPFVKPRVFEALVTAHADPTNQVAEAGNTSEQSPQSGSAGGNDAGATTDLAEGTVVLAPANRTDEGWFEAVVVKVKGDLLTLRWRDYPDEGRVVRRRNQVALFDFAAAGEP